MCCKGSRWRISFCITDLRNKQELLLNQHYEVAFQLEKDN